MAYSGSDLLAEIRRLIDTKLERGRAVKAAWIANEVVKQHPGIQGADAEFHRFCAQHWVREQVAKALKHYNCTVATEADPQLVLPGYSYLQLAYPVARNGEQVILPIHRLTSEELEAKACELDAMALGARAHAIELRAYTARRHERSA
jgi:hypothetical protein